MSDVPKYQLLVEELRHLVDTQPVGAPVPSERVLAERAGVSRMTARRALDMLERDGYVQRIVGKGSFVSRPAVTLPLRLTSFTEDMRARGLKPSSRVREHGVVRADEQLAAHFGLDRHAALFRLVRVRLADDMPFAIERTHLRASAVPGIDRLDLANESLYTALEREYGLRFDGGTQTIRAGSATSDDAGLLGIEPGAAVLELVRTSMSHGEVIERTTSIYPGDRFELSAAIAPASAAEQVPASALRTRHTERTRGAGSPRGAEQ
jgi:GntR family transcriptional regulator